MVVFCGIKTKNASTMPLRRSWYLHEGEDTNLLLFFDDDRTNHAIFPISRTVEFTIVGKGSCLGKCHFLELTWLEKARIEG